MRSIPALCMGALVAVPLGLSCASSLASVRSPDVSLVRVESAGLGLLQQELVVTLRVANPNPDPLTLRGVRFDLDASGDRVASGTQSLDVVLPPYEETELRVTARAGTVPIMRQLAEAADRGELDYRIRGRFLIDHSEVTELPFESQGELID